MEKSVLIIGGGLGGLVCGAILAKEGYAVRVLEKHTVAGGGLHMFSREGVDFETGIHYVSGFQKNGVLRRLFAYLGIMDKLRVKPADPDGFDQIHFVCDGKTYKIATGRENFVKSLCEYFPEEKLNIQRYVDKIYEISENTAMFNLRAPKENYYFNTEYMLTSVSEFIASYTNNEKLQAVLAWNNGLYGGQKDVTPSYVGALVSQFYIEGASRFIDGSQQLADALVEVIVKNGGEVIVGNGAKFIDIHEKQIQKVIADNHQEFTADWYISAIHTSALFKLIDLSKLQKSYYTRIDNIPNSYSTFILFITFKPDSFPYLNHTGYYVYEYEDVWRNAEYTEDNWPLGCMYITPPVTENDIYAQKMIVNTIMNFDTVKKWEDTTIENRGDDYLAFKANCENKVLDMMEKIFPDFRSKIDSVFSSTPLTIRDYYGTKEGANYGTVSDCRNIHASYIAVRTKISNLLLTGQCVNLHGIMGVPITAVSTCGEILGLEKLLEKINKF